jgi:hypothetical protein
MKERECQVGAAGWRHDAIPVAGEQLAHVRANGHETTMNEPISMEIEDGEQEEGLMRGSMQRAGWKVGSVDVRPQRAKYMLVASEGLNASRFLGKSWDQLTASTTNYEFVRRSRCRE